MELDVIFIHLVERKRERESLGSGVLYSNTTVWYCIIPLPMFKTRW